MIYHQQASTNFVEEAWGETQEVEETPGQGNIPPQEEDSVSSPASPNTQ